MSTSRILKLGLMVVALFLVPASVQAADCKTPQVMARIKDLSQRIVRYWRYVDSAERETSWSSPRTQNLKATLYKLIDEKEKLSLLPPCPVTSRPATQRPPGVPSRGPSPIPLLRDPNSGISG